MAIKYPPDRFRTIPNRRKQQVLMAQLRFRIVSIVRFLLHILDLALEQTHFY